MKGLILKDLLALKKNMKILLALMVFYTVYSIAADINFSYIMSCIGTIMFMSTFSYDEYNHWDKLAMSMPLSAKNIILGKFLTTAVLTGISFLLVTVSVIIIDSAKNRASDIAYDLTANILIAAAAFALCSLMIPFIVKFGVERARFIFFGVFAVFYAVFCFIIPKISTDFHADIPDTALIVIIPAAAAAVTAFSYFISVKIYSAKEF